MSEHTSRKPKRPSEVHVKRATNGGYIVRHSFDNQGAGESYQPPKEYAFGKHGDMMKHVHEATGTDGGAYDGAPDVKGDTVDAGNSKPAGVGRAITGKAPSAKTHGAGAD